MAAGQIYVSQKKVSYRKQYKKDVKAARKSSRARIRAHKAQVSALTGGKSTSLPMRAVATPTRSFLSFNANQPPKTLYATMKCSNFVNLTYADWTRSLYPNSAFDPTGTLGSGKPRYFNTYLGADNTNAIYRKYRVHETYISVDVTNLTTAPILFGLATYKSGTTGPGAVTSLREARERSDTRTMIIPSAQAGGSTRNLKIRVKSKDILSYKDLADDDATGALYTGNPGHLIVSQIFIMPLDGSDALIEANLSVQMLLKCQLYELNDVADST